MKTCQKIIDRLTDKVKEEIDLTDNEAKHVERSTTTIVDGVVRDLHLEFRSSKMLLEAALSPNTETFDHAVLKLLKAHLYVTLEPAKKGRLSRFFSSMWKSISSPFRIWGGDIASIPHTPVYLNQALAHNSTSADKTP